MNSKDTLSTAASNFVLLNNRVLDIAIQKGVEHGVKVAIEHINKEKEAYQKGRVDRRLHNARLLLENYHSFKSHTGEAIYNSEQLNRRSALEILATLEDESFDDQDNLYIESIRKSQQRTAIILKHVDVMLKCFKAWCDEAGDLWPRRFRVIQALYISELPVKRTDIAESEHMEIGNIYKDVNAAIEILSGLFFGIDAMKFK